MKKLLLILTLFAPFLIHAQLTMDDFDTYSTGSFDSQWDATQWVGWFGGASSTVISDEQANSGDNALKVETDNDIVALLGTLNTGTYEISFNQYLPTGSGGYFNMQHNYTNTAGDWAAELYFSDETASQAYIQTNGIQNFFAIVHDTWVENRFVFNFNQEVAEYYYNGVLTLTWDIPTNAGGGAGLNQINGINFFGTCLDGGTGCNSLAYYDDVLVTFIPPPPFDISLSSFSAPSEYTNVPVGHVQPFNFEAEVENIGANEATNVMVTASVYDGSNMLIYSESIGSVATLAAGATATFNTPAADFTPSGSDNFTVIYEATLTEADAEETNNAGMGIYDYTVTDSIYARDDGVYTDGIGANNVTALLGHLYDVIVEEEVTAISMSYGGTGVGETVQGHIYTVLNGIPDALVASTDTFTIETPGAVGAEVLVDLNFAIPVVLPAGEYAFVVEQQGLSNLLISTSTNIFTAGSTVASLDNGVVWDNLEDFGFFVSMNIRPVFGDATVGTDDTDEPEFASSISIFPNPTNGKTVLCLGLEESRDLHLEVFNIQGKSVYSTFDRNVSGSLQYPIDLNTLPTGMYIARITVDGEVVSRKINLTK